MKQIIYLQLILLLLTEISYGQYTDNYVGNFNGTSSYIAVPSTSNLSPTTAITLEAWVHPEGTTGIKMAVVGKNWMNSYCLGINFNNRVIFNVHSQLFLQSKVTSTIPLNKWTHIAATYNGTVTSIYINGVLDTTTTAITGALGVNNDSLTIGGDRSLGFPSYFFKGRLDNIRVWGSARSYTQIIENRFAPLEIFGPTGAYLNLRASFQLDDHALNYGGNGLEIGQTRNLTFIPYSDNPVNYLDYNNNLVVNGTTDYFTANNHSSFNATNAITVEAWVKRDTTGAQPSIQNIVNKSGGSTRYDYALFLTAAGELSFEINSGSYFVKSAPLITNGQWTHVAATYNSSGVNAYAILYINGTYVTSSSFFGNPLIQNNPDNLYIGGIGATSYALNKFKGQIDEVRIWKVERTSAQISGKMYTDETDNNMVDFSFDKRTSMIHVGNTTYFVGNTFAGSAHISSSHLHYNYELTSPIISEEHGFYQSGFENNYYRFFIPQNNPAGVTDSLFINSSGGIRNMKVYVLMSHAWISNMTLKLISPSGTSITLFDRKGEGGNDLMTVFSDDADSLASSVLAVDGPGINPPFSPGIKPHQQLSGFNGQNKQGWWKLRFADNATLGKGYVHRWGINIVSVPIKTLRLTALIQGLYNPLTDKMKGDTAQVLLRGVNAPYPILDSAKAIIDSTGKGNFILSNISNNNSFYIVLKHRNSIETWSSAGYAFTSDTLQYNFTLAAFQSFGSNQIQVDTSPDRFAIYSGDVNKDGIVDASDLSMIDNDAANSVSGYVQTDVNGDNFVDASDLSIADNNVFLGIIVHRP